MALTMPVGISIAVSMTMTMAMTVTRRPRGSCARLVRPACDVARCP